MTLRKEYRKQQTVLIDKIDFKLYQSRIAQCEIGIVLHHRKPPKCSCPP